MPLALGILAIFLGVTVGQFFGNMVVTQVRKVTNGSK